MSLWTRFLNIFRSKANKVLDRAEDPREMLDYSYQRQLELLTKVRRGVADVATSRKRMEMQVAQLEGQATKLQGQAEKSIEMGREDLAREALTRKSGLNAQIESVRTQVAQLQGEEEKLTLAQSRLQSQVESLRTRKETIKATYTAAEAQTRINEAVSGLGDELGDVGMAIQRAEDKTAQMQARASAIDELIASGALDDATAINRWRRHHPRARGDELAGRGRGRAGPSQGWLGASPPRTPRRRSRRHRRRARSWPRSRSSRRSPTARPTSRSEVATRAASAH